MWMQNRLWDALEKKAMDAERSVNWLIGKAVEEYLAIQVPTHDERNAQGPKDGGKKG